MSPNWQVESHPLYTREVQRRILPLDLEDDFLFILIGGCGAWLIKASDFIYSHSPHPVLVTLAFSSLTHQIHFCLLDVC